MDRLKSRRKYKYFIVCEVNWCEANPERNYHSPQVLRGLTKESVTRRFINHDWRADMRNDYGGAYSMVTTHDVIAEFETKQEAENALNNWEAYIQTY